MKRLLSYDFQFVQNIDPVLDRNGEVKRFYPQEEYKNRKNLALHKYGDGAFCRFAIDPQKWSSVSGIYAYFIDDALVYIGQALDFSVRFNQGYGYISPKACFAGGQSTNCKINKVVLEASSAGKIVSLYFYITGDFHRVERELIEFYNPVYNTALRSDHENLPTGQCLPSRSERGKSMVNSERSYVKNPSVHEVRSYISKLIETAKYQGNHELTIRSGEIHAALNMSSALPTVCSAMRTLPGQHKYVIIDQPPKGNGSWLVFKYLF